MKKQIAILFAIFGLFLTACQPKSSTEQKKAELLKVFEWQKKMSNWIIYNGVKNTFSQIDEMTLRQIEKYNESKYDKREIIFFTAHYLNQFENTPSAQKILKKHPERPLPKEVFDSFNDVALDTKIGLYNKQRKQDIFDLINLRKSIAPKIYQENFDPLLLELDNMEIHDSEIKEYVKKLRTLTMLHYEEIHEFEIRINYYDDRNKKSTYQKWNTAQTEFEKIANSLYSEYCLPDCPFKPKEIISPFTYFKYK